MVLLVPVGVHLTTLALVSRSTEPVRQMFSHALERAGTRGDRGESVTFTKVGDTVQVVADITGLTPGKHGFHIHEFGDCSAADASSAGGHFNPMKKPHGAPDAAERHAGDLGNLEADSTGKAHLELKDIMLKLSGENCIMGRGVIVHEKVDDWSQPTGNAGGRVACGVIGVAKP